MKDPLLALVSLKPLAEIIAAAKETIHRHRRRFLQRNIRPRPLNCKGADVVGHTVRGCQTCGSHNPEQCIQEDRFFPLYTKEQLAQQFADQLRDPEVLLREYRDITVFLWVLGAFDKQRKTVDEHIVSQVEQREKPKVNTVAAGGGDLRTDSGRTLTGLNDSKASDRIERTISDNDRRPNRTGAMQRRIVPGETKG